MSVGDQNGNFQGSNSNESSGTSEEVDEFLADT